MRNSSIPPNLTKVIPSERKDEAESPCPAQASAPDTPLDKFYTMATAPYSSKSPSATRLRGKAEADGSRSVASHAFVEEIRAPVTKEMAFDIAKRKRQEIDQSIYEKKRLVFEGFLQRRTNALIQETEERYKSSSEAAKKLLIEHGSTDLIRKIRG